MAFESDASRGCVWSKTDQLEIVCWPINPDLVRSFWLLWCATLDHFTYKIASSDSSQTYQNDQRYVVWIMGTIYISWQPTLQNCEFPED